MHHCGMRRVRWEALRSGQRAEAQAMCAAMRRTGCVQVVEQDGPGTGSGGLCALWREGGVGAAARVVLRACSEEELQAGPAMMGASVFRAGVGGGVEDRILCLNVHAPHVSGQGNVMELREEYLRRRGVLDMHGGKLPVLRNQWPARCDEAARKTVERFHAQCADVAETLLRAMTMVVANAPDASSDAQTAAAAATAAAAPVLDAHSLRDHVLEVKSYPALPQTADDLTQIPRMRMQEHVDLSTLTILLQDRDTESLEVLVHDEGGTEQWTPVSIADGSFLVNAGAFLPVFFGPEFPAARHRVRATAGARTSCVYFATPNWHTPLVDTPEFQHTHRENEFVGDVIPFPALEEALTAVAEHGPGRPHVFPGRTRRMS